VKGQKCKNLLFTRVGGGGKGDLSGVWPEAGFCQVGGFTPGDMVIEENEGFMVSAIHLAKLSDLRLVAGGE